MYISVVQNGLSHEKCTAGEEQKKKIAIDVNANRIIVSNATQCNQFSMTSHVVCFMIHTLHYSLIVRCMFRCVKSFFFRCCLSSSTFSFGLLSDSPSSNHSTLHPFQTQLSMEIFKSSCLNLKPQMYLKCIYI